MWVHENDKALILLGFTELAAGFADTVCNCLWENLNIIWTCLSLMWHKYSLFKSTSSFSFSSKYLFLNILFKTSSQNTTPHPPIHTFSVYTFQRKLSSVSLTWRCCLGSRRRSWFPGCQSCPRWQCLRPGCCPGTRRTPRTRWARRPSCCRSRFFSVCPHSCVCGCCLLTVEIEQNTLSMHVLNVKCHQQSLNVLTNWQSGIASCDQNSI